MEDEKKTESLPLWQFKDVPLNDVSQSLGYGKANQRIPESTDTFRGLVREMVRKAFPGRKRLPSASKIYHRVYRDERLKLVVLPYKEEETNYAIISGVGLHAGGKPVTWKVSYPG